MRDSILNLKQPETKTSYSKCCQDQHGVSIETIATNYVGEFIRSKSVAAETGQMGSYARVSTRRFTRTHIRRIWNSHSVDFGGMNSSSMVSTRCGCGPSVNFFVPTNFARNSYVHGVSSVNRNNLTPANRGFLERIDNSETFVKENYLGSNEEQVSQVTDQATPGNGRECVMESTVKNRFESKTKTEYVERAGEKEVTFRSKNVRVTHRVSFSRNKGSL